MHDHIMNCLKFEVSQKLATGKIGYMKRMWKWLTSNEWEIYDEQMKEETKPTVEARIMEQIYLYHLHIQSNK